HDPYVRVADEAGDLLLAEAHRYVELTVPGLQQERGGVGDPRHLDTLTGRRLVEVVRVGDEHSTDVRLVLGQQVRPAACDVAGHVLVRLARYHSTVGLDDAGIDDRGRRLAP